MLIVSERPAVSGGSQERRLTYQVRDSVAGTQVSPADAAQAVLAVAPPDVDGFAYLDWRSTSPYGVIHEVELEYGNTGRNRPEPEVGSAQFSHRTSLETVRIFSSLETVAAQIDPDQVPVGATISNTFFGGAINVDSEGRAQGTSIQVPITRFQFRYRLANTALTDIYRLLIEDLTGMVNQSPFKNRAAGSVRFDGANETAVQANDTTLTFDFTRRPNLTGVQIGNINLGNVDGWDYVWAYYVPRRDDQAKRVRPLPAMAFAERIYPRADLNLLGIP